MLFSAEDCGHGPETLFHLSNTRRSAESRNLMFFIELEMVDRVQKFPAIYSTRTVDQSEETLNPLLNTKRWSESRNSVFYTEQKIMDLV